MKYKEYLDELNDSLTFKTKFIPTQEELDELFNEISKTNNHELVWRLAFSFSNSNYNFDKFIDYYIKEKDMWFLEELLYAITEERFNDKDIYNRIEDKEFLKEYVDFIKHYYGMTDEQIKEYFKN
ncbi:MAG: hypothetical protein IKP98_02930 [Bacilli bacterium]|nr:hypothetical protein [Bacilli bacterium]